MRRRMSSGSDMRPGPDSPSASSPSSGPISSTPRSRNVAAFACVAGCSHIRPFIAGATSSGPRCASAASVEDVVGDALRELRERVRGARRHDEQVGALEVRIEILVRGPPRERGERLRGDELLGAGRDERNDVVPGP